MMGDREEEADDDDSRLAEIRKRLDETKAILPTQVNAGEIDTRSRIPFKALCCRAALLWRIEELGRSSLDSIDKGDVVSAMVLTRSLIETACVLYHLQRVIARQVENGVEATLDEMIMRLLVGGRTTSGVQAVNVLTMIDRAGIRGLYDNLSETAHPNYDGTGGAFSKFDTAVRTFVQFGRGIAEMNHRHLVIVTLRVPLLIAQHADERITELMPAFIKRCEEATSPKSNPSV